MSWQVYDAKARFSEFLETTLKEGPQVLTRRGVDTAVLVSIEEWKQLQGHGRPSIKDVLLDPNGPHDIALAPHRPVLKLRPVLFEDEEQA